jgi:hypothetical protein
MLAASAGLAQSAAPFRFGFLLDRFGVGAVALSAGLSLAAATAFFALRARAAAAAREATAGR